VITLSRLGLASGSIAVEGVAVFFPFFEGPEEDDPNVVVFLAIICKLLLNVQDALKTQVKNRSPKMDKMSNQMVKLMYPLAARHQIEEFEIQSASFLSPQASNPLIELRFEERENGVTVVRKG